MRLAKPLFKVFYREAHLNCLSTYGFLFLLLVFYDKRHKEANFFIVVSHWFALVRLCCKSTFIVIADPQVPFPSRRK